MKDCHPLSASFDVRRTCARLSRSLVAAACLIAAALSGSIAGAQVPDDCGSLENAYGPYDYTNPIDRAEKLGIVEEHHFDSNVIELRHGAWDNAGDTGKSVLNGLVEDIAYTLRAFPNHPHALNAMARLHLREGTEDMRRRTRKVIYSLPCWFDRAQRFKPDDGAVYEIHGIYLYQAGRYEDALVQMNEALRLAPDASGIHYNIGLLYLKLEDYESANEHAKIAYEIGHPLPGLRRKLQDIGEW